MQKQTVVCLNGGQEIDRCDNIPTRRKKEMTGRLEKYPTLPGLKFKHNAPSISAVPSSVRSGIVVARGVNPGL
ncbi:MAG: hypothetical protein V5A47_12775 [Bacteroidales bacterium]